MSSTQRSGAFPPVRDPVWDGTCAFQPAPNVTLVRTPASGCAAGGARPASKVCRFQRAACDIPNAVPDTHLTPQTKAQVES